MRCRLFLMVSFVSLGRPNLRFRQSRVSATAPGVIRPNSSRSCKPSRTFRSTSFKSVVFSLFLSLMTRSQISANERLVSGSVPRVGGFRAPLSPTTNPLPFSRLPISFSVDVPTVVTLLRNISAWHAMPSIAAQSRYPLVQSLAERFMAGNHAGVFDLGVWERKDGTAAARFIVFEQGTRAYMVAVWPETALAISEHRITPNPSDRFKHLRKHWEHVSSAPSLTSGPQ